MNSACYARYYWRIKLWDENAIEGEWSNIEWFETGIMDPYEWKKASWIGGGQYLRKEFKAKKEVAEARAYVTGLGYYELRINGKRVGDKVLDPPWSDYDKTVYYSVYDVTDFVRYGPNAIGIVLGRGRYAPRFKPREWPWPLPKFRYYNEPEAIFMLRIKYTDGTEEWIVSDSSWKCLDNGPILDDDIYNGYKYDARLEPVGWDLPGFDDSSWRTCKIVEPPKGKLVSGVTIPPTRVVGYLKPKEYYHPKPGVYVFDFGQNMTGWVRLKVRGLRGMEVKVRHAEVINPDGSLNTATLGPAEATDVYILRGEGIEVLEPRFTYHGFRYVEVSGTPNIPTIDDIEAVVIHTDLEPIGSIATSNKLINDIHRIILWSLKSNMMNGVQTDCPQRAERMGWLGDAWLSSESAVLNFNMLRFYEKFVKDILDAQRDDGAVPDVVPPYWELYPADPAWGTALVYIPSIVHKYYGDVKILQLAYEAMKKWWLFLYSMAKGNILYFSKYGDWVPPGIVRTTERAPGEIVSTWILYRDAVLLSDIAMYLGRIEDAEYFKKKANEIKDAFNKTFLMKRGELFRPPGYYSKYTAPDGTEVLLGGSQTYNALPLAMDMTPLEEVSNILTVLVRSVEVEWDKHLNSGIIGTKYIPEALAKYGYVELAYEALIQETFPSIGYMIKEGATTLWERWEPLKGTAMNSHNHHMFGSVDAWFYRYIVGLDVVEPGFKRFRVKPNPVKNLSHASASIYVPARGLILVSWWREEESFKLKLTVPVGSVAEVYLPKISEKVVIVEGDKYLITPEGITMYVDGVLKIWEEEKYVIAIVSSGFYEFSVTSYKK